ncbi:MAG: sulfatase [Acidobacteria bacterium]|nr:sulfatase [Acidobacteriota bacterium]
MAQRKINRRQFVAAGTAAAGAAQVACSGKQQVVQAVPPPQPEQPQEQTGNGLNLILICVDTWGANYVGAYGNTWIKTPNVDRLAAKSALFVDAYPETLPTIPTRRVLYTGRRIFPTQQIVQPDDQVRIRGWHQLFAEDITFAEMLRKASYTTALISDLYHTFKPNKNFHRGFDCWRWIRGQEQDRWESGPKSKIDVAAFQHPTQKGPGPFQYLLNRLDWKKEEDWLAPRVFTDAMRWLDRNATEAKPFYLHIESFSPHEYWDPFDAYYRLYMKSNYKGPRLIQPPLTTKDMSEVEVEHARALYFGLVTMVDTWVGKFLNKVESLGLMKNTMVVFLADHGTMMGEQGHLHKLETRLRHQVTRVPLMIYDPRKNYDGRKIRGYVQHPDVVPSLLEMLGLKPPKRVTGESFVPMLAGARTTGLRDTVITGWGIHASVRTPEWNYITRWTPGDNFAEQLYNLQKDADELTNVVVGNRAVASEYRKKLDAYIASGRGVTEGTFKTDFPESDTPAKRS